MLNRIGLSAALAGIALTPMQATFAESHEAAAGTLEAIVLNGEGKQAGTVTLEQTPNGVLIEASVDGLPEGFHGFHIHEKGICDPTEGFKTAGGHYAPRSQAHGIKEAAGPHAGDMPNQYAGSDGKLRAQVLNPNVTLGPAFNSLADEDGSALVIHAGSDDYTSQPTGAAGGRLACAVLSPPKD